MAKNVGIRSPANLAHQLRGIDFPARRQELVEVARRHNAGDEVIQEIERMPDQEYKSMADVMAGFSHIGDTTQNE